MDELLEWEAFYQVEPWGCPPEDDRWRLHYALFWKANFKGQPPEWLDRMPEETARARARLLDDELTRKAEAFFSGRPQPKPQTEIDFDEVEWVEQNGRIVAVPKREPDA